MNKIAAVRTMAGALLLLSACGPKGGKDGDVLHAPPALTSVSLNLSYEALNEIGDTVAFVVTGHYDDGSAAAVDGAWTSSNGAAVSLSAASGPSVAASALTPGTSTVSVAAGGFSAQATVDVITAATIVDPGPVLGIDDGWSPGGPGLYRYPSMGGGAPTCIQPSNTPVGYPTNGLVLNRAGTWVYYLETDPDTLALRLSRETLLGGSHQVVSDTVGTFGLEEHQDKIYSINPYGGVGRVYRYDPSNGQSTEYCSYSSPGMMLMLNVAVTKDPSSGKADVPFYFGYGVGLCTGIYKQAFPSSDAIQASVWAAIPTGTDYYGQANGGGLVADKHGNFYYLEVWDNRVFKYVDANQNGTALDDAPPAVFATLPVPDADIEHCSVGLALGRAGTLLVDIQNGTSEPDASHGIYWVVDRDGSGAADGIGEVLLYNSLPVHQGDGARCITAPR